MKLLLLVLLGWGLACQNPIGPSVDCRPEQLAVRIERGAPDSVARFVTQVAEHPIGYYERWYYLGSPFVETFGWGAQLPHCIYDREERPDWVGWNTTV